MNDKFGRDPREQEEFQRDRRGAGRSYEAERALRSPEQELETSGPYRQPREPYGETYSQRHGNWRDEPGAARPYEGRSSFDGSDAPSLYGRGSTGAEYGRAGARSSQWRESGGWSVPARGGYAGRGPKGYTRTDERIREDVCDRLSWDDEVDATDIVVRVQNGEVTLEGSVETRHMKRLAEDIAEDVPGVSDVHNTVRVKKPILTEIKEKLTGEADQSHYANTGTRTALGDESTVARNGTP
jgi:osmotically-inducible protein OsmY